MLEYPPTGWVFVRWCASAGEAGLPLSESLGLHRIGVGCREESVGVELI